LVWSDEFDGPAGTGPDPGKWVPDIGGEPQWGNDEDQYYTGRPQNLAKSGAGDLVISARRERLPGMAPCAEGPCDITSGRITTKTKFDQTYGRFEARIKVPDGPGLWPAFWAMGADDDSHPWPANGEIDFMEVIGTEPGTVYGTAHAPGFPAEGIGGSRTLSAGRRLAEDFHTFSVEWSPSRIDWQLDGATYFTLTSGRLAPGQQWVFDHPFYLLMNLAVGGTWPGPATADTPFPATMRVDYVRVYRKTA
jgi:beta-glucanase (GH16 family)